MNLTIPQNPIHFTFLKCGQMITVPMDYFGIAETLNEDGTLCTTQVCVPEAYIQVAFPNGLEFVDADLTKGTYSDDLKLINLGEMCTGDKVRGSFKFRVIDECFKSGNITFNLFDTDECLTDQLTQSTNITSGFSCKDIQECFAQGLDCTQPLTK